GAFKGGALQDVRIYGRLLRPEEVTLLARWPRIVGTLAKAPPKLTGPERDELLTLYVNRVDEAYRKTADRLVVLENEQRVIRLRSAVTHVMQERADSPPIAKLLFRGQYDQPRETVTPA